MRIWKRLCKSWKEHLSISKISGLGTGSQDTLIVVNNILLAERGSMSVTGHSDKDLVTKFGDIPHMKRTFQPDTA